MSLVFQVGSKNIEREIYDGYPDTNQQTVEQDIQY